MRCTTCLLSLLLTITGCDVLFPPAETEEPTGGRPRRDEDDDDDDDTGEGEGEGEGEEVPTDPPPDPRGPVVLSFTASQATLNNIERAVLTAIVTDPDGVADIVGAVLVDPTTDNTIGTMSPEGAPGTFTASINWSTFSQNEPVAFETSSRRQLRLRLIDAAAHETTSTLTITLSCGGVPACDGACDQLTCPAQEFCFPLQGEPMESAERCDTCDLGCTSCAAGAADCPCFIEADRCGGNDICRRTVDIVDNQRLDLGTTCSALGVITLRTDGFIEWVVDGIARPVLPGGNSAGDFETRDLFDLLCQSRGGTYIFDEFVPLPADLEDVGFVVGFERDCAPSTLAGANACAPQLFLHPPGNGDGLMLACSN